jgi:ABC-2 type transport system ATP-binding protein
MRTAIRIENVTKTLGNRLVLKGVTFDVWVGDIFGYLGPNGAGKTTTIRILLGLLQADSGRLDIMGQDISKSETRKRVGFALDPDGLYDNMTAEENLEFYARIYGVSNAGERIGHLLGAVGLRDRAKYRLGTYSKGMRQRLALARAMTHDPAVLVLDEPTAGVDPSGQIEVRQIMLDLARKEGRTVFLSSHNLDEVQRICNRIALIDRGEIRLYGETDSLRRRMGGGAVVIETAGEVPQTLLDELRSQPQLGLRDKKERSLVFSPQPGTGVSDIISLLNGRGVRIEGAARQEATLEEMYSAILKEVEPQ